MSLRQRSRGPGLPTSHYFLSVSRGNSIRTATLRPAVLWALVALAPLSLGFGLAGAANLAFHDRLALAAAAREPLRQTVYEDRLDEADSRRVSDQDALEGRMRDLAARQDRLERRGAIVAALAAEVPHLPSTAALAAAARLGTDALGAIETLGPKARPGQLPAVDGGATRAYAPTGPVDGGATRAYAPTGPVDGGAARAYAPAGATVAPKAAAPRPLDESLADPRFAPSLATAAENPDLDPATRLDLVGRSLDRLEDGQMIALAAIDRRAARAAEGNAAVLAETGLDPMKLAEPKPIANAGGPFIPVEADPKAPAFDRAAARVARDVSFADQLNAVMPFVPLRRPLSGEAEVTSPFGYRADPFLGRLALHTGVDLLQPYGAEIRATGAGRVVHAGPMGGYGDMVEIDHGNGLATRYGHMSEILVEEGQEVAQGEVLGLLGSSGRSTGPHLHYEVRVDGEPVDPERFMRAGGHVSGTE